MQDIAQAHGGAPAGGRGLSSRARTPHGTTSARRRAAQRRSSTSDAAIRSPAAPSTSLLHSLPFPVAMGIRGVRVTTFSPFEMRAFGDIAYEITKKIKWHGTNLMSTWSSMIPAMVGTQFGIRV